MPRSCHLGRKGLLHLKNRRILGISPEERSCRGAEAYISFRGGRRGRILASTCKRYLWDLCILKLSLGCWVLSGWRRILRESCSTFGRWRKWGSLGREGLKVVSLRCWNWGALGLCSLIWLVLLGYPTLTIFQFLAKIGDCCFSSAWILLDSYFLFLFFHRLAVQIFLRSQIFKSFAIWQKRYTYRWTFFILIFHFLGDTILNLNDMQFFRYFFIEMVDLEWLFLSFWLYTFQQYRLSSSFSILLHLIRQAQSSWSQSTAPRY